MTLSAHEQRVVDDHVERRRVSAGETTGCTACRRRLAIGAALSSLLPLAVVPRLTGLSPVRYRAAVGARTRPVGPAAVDEERTDRARKYAFVGAIAVLVLFVGAAVALIRGPFDGDTTPATSNSQVGSTAPGTQPGTLPGTQPGTQPGTESTTSAPESTTTTTQLDLRPPPTGPENRVELVVSSLDADGDTATDTPAQGFAPAAPSGLADASLSVTSPAPIFAGGTGTIDVAITNSGTTTAALSIRINVPRGVVLDRLVEGAAQCVDPPDDSASCITEVEPGQTSVLTLRFDLTSSVVGRFVVVGDLVEDDLEVSIDATPRLVHTSVGRGDLVMIGNTLMTCSEVDPACPDARNGVGDIVNRWDLPAAFVDVEPALGWANSSSAELDLAGASVEAAYLFWSGDLKEGGVQIPNDDQTSRISLAIPNFDAPIEVDAAKLRLGDVDATQYFGFADVTDIVSTAGPGTYVLGNVRSVEEQGSYAGWSLVVVTDDASLPRREFVITSPFAWFSPDDEYLTTMPVPPSTGRASSLDLLTFEGERGFVEESLTVGGVQLGTDSIFDSSIVGSRTPEFVNNFGIGIDAYDFAIDTPDGVLSIETDSRKDGVRLAVLGLAVDLE